MRFRSVLGIWLALAVLLGACQPLPQPFRPDDARRAANPLLDIPDGAGVLVLPVDGMRADAGPALAREMADALLNRNLPAFTESAVRSSYRLRGDAIAVSLIPGRTQIRLTWKLYDGAGAQRGEHVLDMATRSAAWDQARPSLLHDLAVKSAGPLAAIIQVPEVRKETKQTGPLTWVAPIEGAPSIAASLLRTELEASLRGRKFRIVPEQSPGGISVLGKVSRQAAGKDRFRLSVDWTLVVSEGRGIGTVRQANEVTTNDLENEWPALARGIATGAADGIGDAVRKAGGVAAGPTAR
ncbi:MAG: hypothetical protein VW547_08310 [Alphaproteobacteria bacterium]